MEALAHFLRKKRWVGWMVALSNVDTQQTPDRSNNERSATACDVGYSLRRICNDFSFCKNRP
jgi:hypothetical protein